MNVGPERHVDSTTANKNSDTQEGCSVMENFAPHKISSKRFKRPVVPGQLGSCWKYAFFFLSFSRPCVIRFIRSSTNLWEFLVLLFALVHSSYLFSLICQPPGGPRDTGWKGARIPHAILNCQGLQWLLLLAESSLPDGMFAGFAGAALKFKKICRIKSLQNLLVKCSATLHQTAIGQSK